MKRVNWLCMFEFCMVAFLPLASAFGGGLNTDRCQLWTQDSVGISGEAEEDDYFGLALAAGDFDRDGSDDLAIGVMGEDMSGIESCGAVNIIYGSDAGLRSYMQHLLHQDVDGVGDACEARDFFGKTLASGDFNDDDYDDLVVGVPGEDLEALSLVDCGKIHVIYGGVAGLDADGSQIWSQAAAGVVSDPEDYEAFGSSFAVGYFNSDDYADLAIAVVSENLPAADKAGAVHVLYGSESGLTAAGAQFWHQDSNGIAGVAEENDYFGSSLAAGDFNGDGIDDLAVGVPCEDSGGMDDCGAVNIIFGTAGGLDAAGNQLLVHDDLHSGGTQAEAQFGTSLSAGDFNGDGRDDLAIGIRWKSVGAVPDCGAVQVAYGSGTGISLSSSQFWHQDRDGVPGQCESQDEFGTALAAGNFDGDCCDDLAIGIEGESIGTSDWSGSVYISYGLDENGLNTYRSRAFNQGQSGVIGEPGESERMGRSLCVGDFDLDGIDDLAVGVPWEHVGDLRVGGVLVFYGVSSWDGGPSWDPVCQSLGSTWRRLDWFGDYSILDGGWIWHLQHEYYYVTPDSEPADIYFYAMDMGWFWTSNRLYSYYYRFSDQKWLWYQEGSKNPRWFVVLDTGEWEEH